MHGTWHQNLTPITDKAPGWPKTIFVPAQPVQQIVEGLSQAASVRHDNFLELLDGSELHGHDLVVTLYHRAVPAKGVREVMLPMRDRSVSDLDLSAINKLVAETHAAWKAGQKVVVRCHAGLNQSSLVIALVLMRDGYTAKQAAATVAATRGISAIHSPHFLAYLRALDLATPPTPSRRKK